MRKRIIALLLAAAMVVSTAACGASDNNNTGANENKTTEGTGENKSTEAGASSQETESQASKTNGTDLSKGDRTRYLGTAEEKAATVNITTEPPQLFSVTTTDANSLTIIRHIMENLVMLDENDSVIPGVAESWEKSEDGLVYTFKLREGMKWSNGEAVTANDFVYAWTALLDPAFAAEYSYMGYIFKNGEKFANGDCKKEDVGVKALSDYELEVTLERPTAYALSMFAFGVFAPLNQKAYEQFGDKYGTDADKIVTNGAFTIDSWEHSSKVVLKKNPDFHRADEVQLETINMVMIKEANAVLNAFKTGELDITTINADQTQMLEKEGFATNDYDDGGCWYLEYNVAGEYLKNQKLRQAIGHAVDSKTFVNDVLKTNSKIPTCFVPKAVKGLEKSFPEEVGQDWTGFNPEEAKKLYQEALKELGTDSVTLTMISDDTDAAKKYAAFIQEQLKVNLGMDIQIETMPFKSRLQRMTDKDFDMVFAGWSPDYNDPNTFLDMFETDNGNNHTSYSDEKYDELLDKARSEADAKKRMEYMYELDRKLMEDLPVAPIFWRAQNYVVSGKIASNVVRTAFQDLDMKYAKLN